MKKLPTTVVVLGAVSFFNDIASDMILPLLPIFLTATLGAGPAVLGLIEGVAEATASLLKLWARRLGDAGVGHKRLALTRYSISNAVRPLIGFVGSWSTVPALRFADRIGKGIRTAPRDALLASVVPGALAVLLSQSGVSVLWIPLVWALAHGRWRCPSGGCPILWPLAGGAHGLVVARTFNISWHLALAP